MIYADRRPPKRIRKVYRRSGRMRYHKRIKLHRLQKLLYWMRNNYIGSHGLWLKRQHEINPPIKEWRIDYRRHDVRLDLNGRTQLDFYGQRRLEYYK